MAAIKSQRVSGVNPQPAPISNEVITMRERVVLTAAQLLLNNVIEIAFLPANCLPVGYKIRTDSLDSNATKTITFDVGIINAAENAVSVLPADGNAKWVVGSTLAQAGGLLLDTASAASYKIPGDVLPLSTNRIFGLAITAVPATAVGGMVEVEFSYKAY